jgi:hypothetical protein
VDFETALDELYAAAPEDFVAERARLAKALKAEGEAAEAQRLSELRKPVLAAWVLNRLVRDRCRDVDLLLHSGHRMRLAKGREAFDDARRAEREAVDKLTTEAAKLLEARGSTSEAILGQVADSLRAAAISEEGRELLSSGRFTQPFQGDGFDVLSALAPSTPARRTNRPDPDKQRKAKAALTEAKTELRLAEREAEAARSAAERAEAKVEAARRNVAAAEERLRRV